MASAGPEAYNLGLKKGSQFQLGIPSGLTVPPLTAKLHESKVWYLANQSVKPIWQLEQNHVTAPHQDNHLVHSGLSCQHSRLLYPESLCGEAVLQSPPPPPAQSLPNFLGSTLLYRRSYFRHKPYRRLDSICLQPSTLEKKPFRIPLPVYRSGTNNTMSSSTMDPFLVPSTVGERSSPVAKVFPLSSGKQSSSSYKPMLNNNSFLRPTSAKVPLQQHPQPPESKKLKGLLRPHGFSWTHTGGNGDSCPVSLERKFAKASSFALEQANAKSHLPVHNGTVLKPERPTWRLEDGENRSQNLKEQDVRLTEAMRKLTASGVRKVGTYNEFGHRIDSSCLMNTSFHHNLFTRWRPHIVAQITPKEVPATNPPNLEHCNRHQNLTSTEAPEVCTKRISIRLITPNPEPSNLSTLSKPANPPPVNIPEPPVKTDLPPQTTVSEVETKISSLQLSTDTKLGPPIIVKDTE